MGNMLGGITGRGFLPGKTGNPLGSSRIQRDFAKAIRERSKDGKALLDFLFTTMADEDAHPVARFKSAELLIQYGYGKPREQEDGDGLTVDASKLDDGEREQLVRLLSKLGLQGERPREHPESGESGDGSVPPAQPDAPAA